MKLSHILGLNARSQLFSYPSNTARGRNIASSKVRTKRILGKAGLPVPELYTILKEPSQILDFDWLSLPKSFALKPNRGLGGQGIIVVKKRVNDSWITTINKSVDVEDLKLHALDILEGAYSIDNSPDIAFIEEYVGRHKAFRKYAYRGTPDIRVIVFNKVPVMAMLRLPTKESGGRANLHQGAIAVGIDITTGITTRGYWHGKYIYYKPNTKRKLNGIKIPNWTKILELAVECQEVTGLGYLGADIVLHPEKGPQVLELNYQPGLEIQMANGAGLRRRLEKVDDIKVENADHGARIAKALFTGPFSSRVKPGDEVKTVNVFEEIFLKTQGRGREPILAKLDTGAWRTSIDRTLARKLGLLKRENVLWYRHVRSSLGSKKSPVIQLTFWLDGKKINTTAGVAERGHLKKQVIIGRQDLVGFLVKPTGKASKTAKKT